MAANTPSPAPSISFCEVRVVGLAGEATHNEDRGILSVPVKIRNQRGEPVRIMVEALAGTVVRSGEAVRLRGELTASGAVDCTGQGAEFVAVGFLRVEAGPAPAAAPPVANVEPESKPIAAAQAEVQAVPQPSRQPTEVPQDQAVTPALGEAPAVEAATTQTAAPTAPSRPIAPPSQPSRTAAPPMPPRPATAAMPSPVNVPPVPGLPRAPQGLATSRPLPPPPRALPPRPGAVPPRASAVPPPPAKPGTMASLRQRQDVTQTRDEEDEGAGSVSPPSSAAASPAAAAEPVRGGGSVVPLKRPVPDEFDVQIPF